MGKSIAVIDGNSLMHRAFHAVPPTMNAPDGTPTNAVFGFVSMLLKFIDVANPDAIVCAFDAGRPKHRMEALEQYKGQRPPMDPGLKAQFPLIEDLLTSLSIPVVKIPGWEGDDILGTIAARDDALGFETLLVTGDKDAYQLASEHTSIVTTKKGISDITVYGPKEVEERYGILPHQVPDFLGLKGDSSDNIPGVPGIGEKTASKLIREYGNLEGLYDNLDKLKGKQLENVTNNKDAAFTSRMVATIICDLDFPLDLEQIAFPAFDDDAVIQAFDKLNFHAHLKKVLALQGSSVPEKEPIDIAWKPIKDATEKDVLAAIDEDVMLGVACGVDAQATLFDNGINLAVALPKGTYLTQGEKALELLKTVVSQGTFAALDVKKVLQEVFPADTSHEAMVTDEQIAGAKFFDVSLAAYLLNSSVTNYSVETLVDTYLQGAAPQDGPDSELIIEAACVRALVDPLHKALEDDESLAVYQDIDAPLVAVLAQMERTGAAIDAKVLEKLGASTQKDIDALKVKIYAEAGEEFNIDSPKQVGHILFEVLGLPAKKKTQRGYSTDAKVLGSLAEVHPLPALILQYRELAKIKSTYIDALPRMRGDDGRLHTSFNQTVTTTGRLSSSDPNLQNIPVRTEFGRHIRECFVPLRPGEVFVSADYSQIELRLLAHLSGDEHLIAAFNSGADFHTTTAARVFGIEEDDVTPELRSRAKAVNFGIVYGQQAFGLAQSLKIPFGEAQDMIDRYFEAYPGVRSYLDTTVAEAKENGYAQTMYGRKRHIPELRATNGNMRGFGERTAMNHPMQGSAADIIKLAMVQVQKLLREKNLASVLMVQVHDELDLSVPEDELAVVEELLHDVMEGVVKLSVPLSADVSSGPNWSVAH